MAKEICETSDLVKIAGTIGGILFVIIILFMVLAKEMMYQTFCVVIDYLLYSRKISIDAEGKIGWIYYPEAVKERIKNKHLFWSSS